MTTLVPFDHTYILYDPNHAMSLGLAVWSLFPILVLAFLLSWFLLTREIEPCLLAVGQVANDVVSGAFKKLVRYERPLRGRVFKEEGGLLWGMPSSHSQFMAFWATYCALMYVWHSPPKALFNVSHIRGTLEQRIVRLLGLAVLGTTLSFVVASRLYFGYHNIFQVAVGVLLGAFLGASWYVVVCLSRDSGLVNWVLTWPMAEIMLMKDTFSRGSLRAEREAWKRSVTDTTKS